MKCQRRMRPFWLITSKGAGVLQAVVIINATFCTRQVKMPPGNTLGQPGPQKLNTLAAVAAERGRHRTASRRAAATRRWWTAPPCTLRFVAAHGYTTREGARTGTGKRVAPTRQGSRPGRHWQCWVYRVTGGGAPQFSAARAGQRFRPVAAPTRHKNSPEKAQSAGSVGRASGGAPPGPMQPATHSGTVQPRAAAKRRPGQSRSVRRGSAMGAGAKCTGS